MTSGANAAPLTVAIVGDVELVQKGLARMCEEYGGRVRLMTIEPGAPLPPRVDIALYDHASHTEAETRSVQRSLGRAPAPKVVVYSWSVHPELVQQALQAGVHGYLAKTLSAAELIEALERIYAGERVVSSAPGAVAADSAWTGRSFGLTQRESEIIALITQGLSNQQIADRSYLSINSVKSYIRSCYRKIGVGSRSQAVLWGIANGFRPEGLQVVSTRGDEPL